jgi:hypothetical protein
MSLLEPKSRTCAQGDRGTFVKGHEEAVIASAFVRLFSVRCYTEFVVQTIKHDCMTEAVNMFPLAQLGASREARAGCLMDVSAAEICPDQVRLQRHQ